MNNLTPCCTTDKEISAREKDLSDIEVTAEITVNVLGNLRLSMVLGMDLKTHQNLC